MLYTGEMKGPTPPPPRKPPVPTDAAASGQTGFDALRRRNRGFLSTILTGGGGDNGPKSLLGL